MAWTDFLPDIDWGGVVQRVIPAAIGSYIVGNANERAANTVANANTAASNNLTAANANAVQLEIAARNAAQARMAPIIASTAPAVNYLRGVMSDQNLTPQQLQYIAEMRRTTAQQLQPNLGGRSATAIATKSANDVYGNTYAANRNRSDAAAHTVAGMNANAIMGANALDTNTAQNIASGLRSTAGDIASGTRDTGNTIGAAGLATANTQAKSIGDVTSPSAMDLLRSMWAQDRKGYASDFTRPFGG